MYTLDLATTPFSLIAPLPKCKHGSIDSISMSQKIYKLAYSPKSASMTPIDVKKNIFRLLREGAENIRRGGSLVFKGGGTHQIEYL